MELTKFDNFAICSDTVQGTQGDFTVTVLLDRDPDVTPDHFDCHSETDKQRWRDDEWFYGLLRAKVSVDVAGQSVLLDDCAAVLGGVNGIVRLHVYLYVLGCGRSLMLRTWFCGPQQSVSAS